MPELPEVETTVRDLKQVRGWKFERVWCNNKKMVEPAFENFKEQIKGKEIERARRRAKLILLDLSDGKTLLIHQKLTGHLLSGEWERIQGEWKAESEPLTDKVNDYLHLVFYLDSGQMLALSDLRKFAKAELWDTEQLEQSEQMQKLGPEPLSEDFDLEEFKQQLKRRRAAVKKILMNQEVVAGIGNIYSDEILWEAEINPLTPVNELTDSELEEILAAMKSILQEAVEARGTSTSDYRDLHGKPGRYQEQLEVYQREGEPCSRCGTSIKRKKVGGRSAHFCPQCQTKP